MLDKIDLVQKFNLKSEWLKRDAVLDFSLELFHDAGTRVYRILIWMIEVNKEFRGQGYLKKFLNELMREAKKAGAETLQFEMLSVVNTRLLEWLKTWTKDGWIVEIIHADDAAPMVRLTRSLDDL